MASDVFILQRVFNGEGRSIEGDGHERFSACYRTASAQSNTKMMLFESATMQFLFNSVLVIILANV